MNPVFRLLFFLACFTVFSCGPDSHSEKNPVSGEEVSVAEPEGEEEGGTDEEIIERFLSGGKSDNRVIWQKPELVIRLLGDLSGKTVADIGAGYGYFSFRILPRAGKVIAIDIDPDAIHFMDSMHVYLPPDLQDRFETRLVTPSDPMLKEGEADVVIVVNTYSYIENRVDYFRNLRNSIAGNGKLLIIDYKKKNIPVGPPSEAKVALSQVEEELSLAGYTRIRTDDQALNYQYIVLASI